MTSLRFDDFKAVDRATWQAEVERMIGRELASLASEVPGGLRVAPLYDASDSAAIVLPVGAGARRRTTPWRAGMAHAAAAPEAVARSLAQDRDFEADLAWIRLDSALRSGVVDPGAHGVRLQHLDEMRSWLAAADGRMHLCIDAGLAAVETAAMLVAATGQPSRVSGAVVGDVFSVMAAYGESPVAVPDAVARTLDLTGWATTHAPELRTILASGVAYHDAGARVADEVALTLAAALAYLDAGLAANMPGRAIAQRIIIEFAVGNEIVIELAKLRAARFLWRSMLERKGVADVEPWIVATSSRRNRSELDPWVNLLRATIECYIAAAGGADEVTLAPVAETDGESTPAARRHALGVQHVLREEAHLAAVIDPYGGSHALEAVTARVAESAWGRLAEITRAGGLAEVLSDGTARQWVEDTAIIRRHAFGSGVAPLVGVNLHPGNVAGGGPQPSPQVVPRWDRGESFTLPKPSPAGHRTEAAVAAMRGRASLASVAASARSLASPTGGLGELRLAAPFEQLRARSRTFFTTHGRHPLAVLIGLGEAAPDRALVQRARGHLASAGFVVSTVSAATTSEGPFPTADVAGLCGERLAVGERGTAIASTLRHAGVRRVFAMVPDPGGGEIPGFDAVCGTNTDATELLEDLMTHSEAAV